MARCGRCALWSRTPPDEREQKYAGHACGIRSGWCQKKNMSRESVLTSLSAYQVTIQHGTSPTK